MKKTQVTIMFCFFFKLRLFITLMLSILNTRRVDMVSFKDNLIRISLLDLKRINLINYSINYHAQVFPWCKGDTLDSFSRH